MDANVILNPVVFTVVASVIFLGGVCVFLYFRLRIKESRERKYRSVWLND